ncbi:MAG TPA: pyridoxal phosphate-dependent aminotransferase [Clostridia bacterium]|nr:pyridoxal phosphate-dependent aminotransferase [Clostridia bacterium]
MELAERAVNINPSPTLSIDAKAKQMKANGIKVINFGAGEPDFDTPDNIKQAAIEAINSGKTNYTPVGGILPLREAIVEKLKRDNGLDYDVKQLVVSVGAKHSLYNSLQVLCQEGDEVILPSPYWVSYLEQIKLTGAKAVIIEAKEENGFKITPRQLKDAVTDKTRALMLNSPSNPTGAVYSRDELAALGEVIVDNKIIVISDEIYEKIVYDDNEHISIAALGKELKDLTVVINGVSKSYAMTGWRIGYMAAPAKIAKAVADLQSHSTSNPTSIAQYASLEALTGSQEQLKMMVSEFAKRREFMFNELKAIPGLTCNKPGGSFYLYPNLKSYFGKSYEGQVINSASDFAGILLEKVQVALVPGIAFGSDDYFRVSYAVSMDDIKLGLERISGALAKIK